MERAKATDTPFFCWINPSRMHVFTHVKDENLGKTGLGVYADGMVEHDGHVGQILQKLDELGLTENTIVVYTADNGPQMALWPDCGISPFRGSKTTNWEGGWRVPALIRWPGTVKPGTVYKEMFASEDWLPTLMAAAGQPDIKDRLLAGHEIGDMTYKIHLDGHDQTEYLAGKVPSGARVFSTSLMMVICWRSGMAAGRLTSWFRMQRTWTCGGLSLKNSVHRCCLIWQLIRLNEEPMEHFMMNGCCVAHSLSSRRRTSCVT